MDRLRLYHRTTPEAAERIMTEHRMVSAENTAEAYFSTEPDDQIRGYGDGLVCIVVPADLAEIEDEFPSGEVHYRVRVADLRPEHFQAV